MNLHRWKDVDYRGQIVRVDYAAPDYEGKPWMKYANVYLPYGYDPNKAYDILYLIHGGGGNSDAWLDCSQIKNAFDQAFQAGTARPFIAVFPCFYSWIPSEHRSEGIDAAKEDSQVRAFQKEFAECLIPAVEGRFHTYAEDLSLKSLQASRRHRAFGGFSMGGSTTWYAFLNHLDIIGTFLPLSGDCWAVQPLGGKLNSEETAGLLAEAVRKLGFTSRDFRLLIGTGDQDIAYGNLSPQVEAMAAYPGIFDLQEDMRDGNMHYVIKEGAPHAYEEVYHHIWNYLPYIFD